MSSKENHEKEVEEAKRQESYYTVLNFIESKVREGTLSSELVRDFKTICRDNKYVATYIRSLKPNLEEMKDFKTVSQKLNSDQSSEKWDVNPNVRELFGWKPIEAPDSVQLLLKLVNDALEREGTICDFRDSIHPEKVMGYCASENHAEVLQDADDDRAYYDEKDEEWKVKEVLEELEMTLYSQVEINKYNDSYPIYICKLCMKDLQENGDSAEVSCDMDYN